MHVENLRPLAVQGRFIVLLYISHVENNRLNLLDVYFLDMNVIL